MMHCSLRIGPDDFKETHHQSNGVSKKPNDSGQKVIAVHRNEDMQPVQMDSKHPDQIIRHQPKRAARCLLRDKAANFVSIALPVKKPVSRQTLKQALCKINQTDRNVLIEVGQLVLAKQKYSVPWPSRIVAIKRDSVDVYFFGDGRCGPVKKCDLFSIGDSREIMINCIKRNIFNYRKAVIEMEKISGIPEQLSITNFV